jgi:hypothetical protein
MAGSPPAAALGRGFAHTLIPIALASFVAHYFSYFVLGEQAQFPTCSPIRSVTAQTTLAPWARGSTTRP